MTIPVELLDDPELSSTERLIWLHYLNHADFSDPVGLVSGVYAAYEKMGPEDKNELVKLLFKRIDLKPEPSFVFHPPFSWLYKLRVLKGERWGGLMSNFRTFLRHNGSASSSKYSRLLMPALLNQY